MIPKERLEMARDLDTDKLIADTEARGDFLTEQQALVVLHKARYQLAKLGHLGRRYFIDSRRWLTMRNHKLPN